jgi:hypothetical protein
MATLYLWLEATALKDKGDEFSKWLETSQRIMFVTVGVWCSFVILAAGLAVVAVMSILDTIKELFIAKTSIAVILLHGALIVVTALNCVVDSAVFCIYAYFNIPNRTYTIFNIVKLSLDFLMQMLLCYICWTQGSDIRLTQFDCEIAKDFQGNYVL